MRDEWEGHGNGSFGSFPPYPPLPCRFGTVSMSLSALFSSLRSSEPSAVRPEGPPETNGMRRGKGVRKETTVRSVLSWSPFPFTHPRPFHLRYASVPGRVWKVRSERSERRTNRTGPKKRDKGPIVSSSLTPSLSSPFTLSPSLSFRIDRKERRNGE